MATRLTALDRAADRYLSHPDYERTTALLREAQFAMKRGADSMSDDALYTRTMVAMTALAEVRDALRDAKRRNERENEYIRAALGNA